MEAFVDFCEDAIFEMQHAASLMDAGDGGGEAKAEGPVMPSEDEPRYIIKLHYAWAGSINKNVKNITGE